MRQGIGDKKTFYCLKRQTHWGDGGWVGKMGKGCQKVQTRCYKVKS